MSTRNDDRADGVHAMLSIKHLVPTPGIGKNSMKLFSPSPDEPRCPDDLACSDSVGQAAPTIDDHGRPSVHKFEVDPSRIAGWHPTGGVYH
jgi:hypothetical protein